MGNYPQVNVVRQSQVGTDFNSWTGFSFFAGSLLLSTVPSGEAWQRTEFASHICLLISAILVVRRAVLPQVPAFILVLWFGFGAAIAFSAAYTSASFIEYLQVLRKVWLIPTTFFLTSYAIYSMRRFAWWLIFSVFACLIYIMMVFSVISTPQGAYIPSVGGYTGAGIRLYLHVMDGSIALIGTAVMAQAFPMMALSVALLIARKHWTAYLGALGFFLYGALAFVTGTRTGLLAAVGASGIVLAIYIFRTRKLLILALILFMALISGSGLFALMELGLIAPEMAMRFSLSELSDTSFTGRTTIWREVLQSIQSNGVGVGYYKSTQSSLQSFSAHNMYIEAFYSLGWVAGFFYTTFVVGLIFWSSRSAFFASEWRRALPLVWFALVFAVYGMLDAIFISSLLMYYATFVCIAACLAELAANDKTPPKRVNEKAVAFVRLPRR